MYHGSFVIRYKCSECSTTLVNKSIWKRHLNESHNIFVELHDAEKCAQKIKNTKKSKLFLAFSNFLTHFTSYSFFPFRAVVEQRAAKNANRNVRIKMTCDVVIDGTGNMNRHKRTQHSIECQLSKQNKKRLATKRPKDHSK